MSPSRPLLYAAGSAVLLGLAVWGLVALSNTGPPSRIDARVRLFCAAGLSKPVEELRAAFTELEGIAIEVVYGGSGALLGSLKIARGDLYLAADADYVERARERGFVAESIGLARIRPVICVADGNPLRIARLEDLARDGVRVAMAHAEAAAIGRTATAALTDADLLDAVSPRVVVQKPTVNELVTDVQLGTVDAAIVWDSAAHGIDGVQIARDERLDAWVQDVTIGVLTKSTEPTAALRLARFLASTDHGAAAFARHGFEPIEGDAYEKAPEISLMCGAMLNAAVDDTIRTFERREGVRVNRVYNGCGVLVAQMTAGSTPDAYFSCDTSFLDLVADRFDAGVVISANRLAIAVAEGNPAGITGLADLSREGLRVGLAHPEKSALGELTRRVLRERELERDLEASGTLKVESPTGDFLVTQLRAGSLDAAVVYRSNVARSESTLDAIPIDGESARARQPFAVAHDARHRALIERLLDTLTDAASRDRFETLGFEWQLGGSR